jgi:hypothetical protein
VNGLPVFVNIRVSELRTGSVKNVYKPRLKMDAEEYRQQIQYHVDMANKLSLRIGAIMEHVANGIKLIESLFFIDS